MGTSPPKPAIYFKSLKLENVRCFGEEQTLCLLDGNGGLSRWTLILGDNGVGKTTLLQCLAWMRPVAKTPDKGGKPDDIEAAINSEENEVFTSLLRSAPEESLKLTVTLTIDQDLGEITKEGEEIEIDLSIIQNKSTLQIKEEGKIKKIESKPIYKKKRKKEPTHLEPTIFAYNATRYMGSSNREEREFSDPLASLFAGGPTELYDAEEILRDFHYRALIEESDNASKKESGPEEKDPSLSHGERLQQVKRLIATVLPEDIESEDSIKILGPIVLGRPDVPSGVEFDTPYGPVPLSGLSLGYKTTLAWVTDMAVRFYEHYDESLNPLEEPAIVLIDEIDLHLHPRWQRKIMGNLTKHFTKTQFIATTHSPSMAQAAANANLVVLRREDDDDHVVIEDSPRFVEAWRVDQILNVLFGVHSRSPRIETMLKRRNKLLNKLKPTLAEETELKKLEEQLDNLPTAERHEDQEAMDFIRRAAALLKERESHQQ